MQDKNTAPEGSTLVAEGFARGDTVETTDRNGKRIAVTTCYEFEAGKWEGFVSIRDLEPSTPAQPAPFYDA